MRHVTTLTLLGLAAAGILACAKAETPADGAAAPADAPELANYERTGEFESCLTSTRISYSRILNSRQILFEMTGGDVYLNEPTSCPGLRTTYALVYTANPNHLCNTTVVNLIEPGLAVPNRGGCGLGRFERLKKKVAEK